MTNSGYAYVTPDELRLGLHVDLEIGWMSHPFPKSSFKITSQRQIDTLRGLGLARVRYLPSLSDPPSVQESIAPGLEAPDDEQQGRGLAQGQFGPPDPEHPLPANEAASEAADLATQLAAQRQSLAYCEQQFEHAMRQYDLVLDRVGPEPLSAAALCQHLVESLLADMLAHGESSIRLLSQTNGDRARMHPVNVTVLSLLLGKALGLSIDALRDLGMAAFLHDVGKSKLPEKVRVADVNFAPAEYKQYQSHVAHGVAIAQQLQLSTRVQHTIGQHHEMMDGSGFPNRTRGLDTSLSGKVLALVNRYENMCNPSRPANAVTPHEALSQIFSQMKDRHDNTVLAAFIRMMGVYPPGSVVQFMDGRFAMVVAVNSARPHKPRVIVHETLVPKDEALILDLERSPTAGIRRSIRPDALPPDAMDYLSPRVRIGYFFERAGDPARSAVAH